MSKPRERSSSTSSTTVSNGKAASGPAVPPQAPVPRPADDNRKGWRVYWQAQNQPWRTEPEIDAERQKYLAQLRAIIPDIEKGIYPFKGVQLNRADVEWLLATHENGHGPVNWSDEHQRERQGLDLRGAYLNDIDFQGLPLARLQGGIAGNDWTAALPEQRLMAAVHLERAILTYAHLEGSILTHAHLQEAKLSGAHLESVDAFGAHFEGPVPAIYEEHTLMHRRNSIRQPSPMTNT